MATQPPPPVLTLTVEKGPRKGEIRQCIAGSALRVGRVVKGNDLAVRDVGASQQHLAIEFLPPPASRWAVSDLGSSNGSFLNGAPLVPTVPAPLSDGNLIKIGESTVLAVSLASDSDLCRGAAAAAGPRRSSRGPAVPAAAEEKKPPAGDRRGTRKKAAVVEAPEFEDEAPDAAAVVVEEEKPRLVTRRGGRKKAAASDPPEEPEKDEEEKEEPPLVTRRGRQKKVAEHPVPEKDEETEVAPVVTQLEGNKQAVEPPEPEPEKEGAKRRGRPKKATEVPEPGKEEEAKAEAPVATRRSARNKGAATAAAPPPPAKTRSRRGRGRGARAASTREAVIPEDEDVEEQEEIEVAMPREPAANHLSTSTVVKSAEAEKIAAGDGEIKVAAKEAPEVEVAKEAASATVANNGCAKENDGGEDEEEDGKAELVGSGGEAGAGEKVEERAGRSSLDTMTLGEWFYRMEKYLVRKIDEYADQSIVELEDQERRLYEYISTLGKQL